MAPAARRIAPGTLNVLARQNRGQDARTREFNVMTVIDKIGLLQFAKGVASDELMKRLKDHDGDPYLLLNELRAGGLPENDE